MLKKPLLSMVFDSVFHLTDEGWRKLTIRWIVFFLRDGDRQRDRLAHADHGFLGRFKTFGFVPLTFVFALAQFPLMQKYAVKPDEAKG